jgi:tRNA A-37 threonylcarbamoyl transferase component Bud32
MITGEDFLGTDRFKLLRRVGAGGMGVVYEAYDLKRDKTVALKTLINAEPSYIYRLKTEFRSLSDVAHPNLVSLYELMSDGRYWFFTMELVNGVNFLEYVRNSGSGESEPKVLSLEELDTLETLPLRVSKQTQSFNEGRLRIALRQLADGLNALHENGKLHRDIKPSNILVTPEGRLVILDFGLVADIAQQKLEPSQAIVGTPSYMSPEQMAQRPTSAASDWYNAGVMLYEALTGHLPFDGNLVDILVKKQSVEPPPPREISLEVPEDLSSLCQDLLRLRPESRPSGGDVIRRLEGEMRIIEPPSETHELVDEEQLVGREEHMKVLEDAFRTVQKGKAVTLYIYGASGMGKSALARHFLEKVVRRDRSVVILEGRCYERESVPYKALDGVIDSLSKYLVSLPQLKAEALMPRDVQALSRLFPVMLRVNSVLNAPQREQEIPDPIALRRRAFGALRELLGRISDRQPLAIYIDDLQWADADSAALLEELLRQPDAPPLLLIVSFRSEDMRSKPFLKLLLEQIGGETTHGIAVEPLTQKEARDLTTSLLPPGLAGRESRLEDIVREAAGSPFFVEQLSRYTLSCEETTRGIKLLEMIEGRLQQQPVGARRFLETLSVAGRPMSANIIHQASGLEGDEDFLITSLRAAKLLRSVGEDYGVELYHDRIREALASSLEKESVRQIHRRLVQTLLMKGLDDPEALFEHYRGAGEQEQASRYAALAAKKAVGALAFDRAALFYRRALELAPAVGVNRVELRAELAQALANAGSPAEAAEHYLEAARNMDQTRALDLQRRAAEQLLMGGHIEEGLQVIQTVLAAVGFKLAAGPKRALLSLLIRRLHLKLRGIKFVKREESKIPNEQLLRIDICWAVTAGLGNVDNIRAADFQTRHLLLALRAGELYRVARALNLEAGFTATAGKSGQKRAAQLYAVAESLSKESGNPHAIGLYSYVSGLAAFLVGQWQRAAEMLSDADEILRYRCTGVTWEIASTQNFLLSSLIYLGEMREISLRVPVLLSAAEKRSNLFELTDLRTRVNITWLLNDDPVEARRQVIEAMQQWTQKGFHRQHYNALLALAQIELYSGNGLVAWKQVSSQWPALSSSMILRVQIIRIEALHLRARCALAAAASGAADAQRLIAVAERLATQISKEGMKWADPLAALLQAGVAFLRDDKQTTISLLSKGCAGFEGAHMKLYAAVAKRRLGEIIGGAKGELDIDNADCWMRDQKIKDPAKITRMLTPGIGSSTD